MLFKGCYIVILTGEVKTGQFRYSDWLIIILIILIITS